MKKRAVTVGIAGCSGSGKSYLAESIAKSFESGVATLLSLDNYYLDKSSLPESERKQLNFDVPEALDLSLLATHVQSLRNGEPIPRHSYDFVAKANQILPGEIFPTPLIIVEGLFTLADPILRAQLDFKVYIELTERTCFERRMHRDTLERGNSVEWTKQAWERIVLPGYTEYIKPSSAYADLRIQGDSSGTSDRVALITMIKNKMNS